LGSGVLTLAAAQAFALPTFAIHPALPYADDEVFIANFGLTCLNGTNVVREAIPGGWRLQIPLNTGAITFEGEQPYPCLQSIGVLGAGRHQLVPTGEPGTYLGDLAAALEPVTIVIPDAQRPAEGDAWTYDPLSLTAVSAYPGAQDRIVRLDGQRFAAIISEPGNDAVSLFGKARGDYRRLDAGFPGPMSIQSLHAAADGQLYVVAVPRAASWDELAVWRFDTVTSRWMRYADAAVPEFGGVVAALRGETIIARIWNPDFATQRLVRSDPGGTWRPLPGVDPTGMFVLGRDLDDALVGVLPGSNQSGIRWKLVRISPETGAVLGSAPLGMDTGSPVQIQNDPSFGMLLVSQTPTSTGASRWRLDRFDSTGATMPLLADTDVFPFAAAADGSHLGVDRWGTLRQRSVSGESSSIAAGGLGPAPVCNDPASNFITPSLTFCSDANSYYPFDVARPNALSVTVSGAVYSILVTSGTDSLWLSRRVSGTVENRYIDLFPALGAAVSDLYRFQPIRLAATSNGTHLMLLVHQYVGGDGYASRIVDIDLAAKTASALAAPPLLSTDLAVSPAGHLLVTTRFGEILRRQAGSTEWATLGHLSTGHFDLHAVVGPQERVFVYGYHGAMAYQGARASVEEFYHAGLDHYFLSADPLEQASLHAHPELGWHPTGEAFHAIAAVPWGPSAVFATPRDVCRFYGSVQPGPNSHFYTGVPSECASLKALQASAPATQPRWNYEGNAFYALGGTAGGNCPSTEQMVTRWFNGGSPASGGEPNHRYAASASAAAEVKARGWILELSAFCVPHATNTRIYAR
jgi:hypothetical protein